MKDYNGEETAEMGGYDMSIHQNPDGQAWAQFFMKTIEENPDIVIDEEFMMGWFCNAMMAMCDYVQNTD